MIILGTLLGVSVGINIVLIYSVIRLDKDFEKLVKYFHKAVDDFEQHLGVSNTPNELALKKVIDDCDFNEGRAP